MTTSSCFWGFSRAVFEDLLLFRISLVVHNIILFSVGTGSGSRGLQVGI